MWWSGMVGHLEPLYSRCSKLQEPRMANLQQGAGVGPHPTQPHLYTKCLVPTNFQTTLSQWGHRFKFKKMAQGRGAKVGCMKLKERGITSGNLEFPPGELYISRLLCYMYRGPPPSPLLEACHMCENRMCLAPWHLAWDSHSSNLKGAKVHKRNMRAYHPYAPPQGAAGGQA